MTPKPKTFTLRLDAVTDDQLATLSTATGLSRNRLISELITDRFRSHHARKQAEGILDEVNNGRAELLGRLRDTSTGE